MVEGILFLLIIINFSLTLTIYIQYSKKKNNVEEIRNEMSNMILKFNKNAERNIRILEDRIKKTKELQLQFYEIEQEEKKKKAKKASSKTEASHNNNRPNLKPKNNDWQQTQSINNDWQETMPNDIKRKTQARSLNKNWQQTMPNDNKRQTQAQSMKSDWQQTMPVSNKRKSQIQSMKSDWQQAMPINNNWQTQEEAQDDSWQDLQITNQFFGNDGNDSQTIFNLNKSTPQNTSFKPEKVPKKKNYVQKAYSNPGQIKMPQFASSKNNVGEKENINALENEMFDGSKKETTHKIAKLIGEGKSLEEISDILGISLGEIQLFTSLFRKRILEKNVS